MAARGAPLDHNTQMMSPAVTLERNNVVKFETGPASDMPKSPTAEKVISRDSELDKRVSLETRSEREIQDLPRDTSEGLFARLLSFKWKSGGKDDGKDIC